MVKKLVSEPTCQLRVSRCNSVRFIVENFDIVSSVVCKAVRIIRESQSGDCVHDFLNDQCNARHLADINHLSVSYVSKNVTLFTFAKTWLNVIQFK